MRTRAHIESLAAAGKIEFTYIVTGPFLDTFIYSRAGGRACYDAQNSSFGIIGDEKGREQHKISGTSYEDTGAYVYSSILTPEAAKNAMLRVSSIDATPDEIQSAVSSIVGHPLTSKYTPLSEFKKLESEAWEKGDATVYTLTRIWFEGGSDFTRRPRATYFRDGKWVEDKGLEKALWRDVEKKKVEEVLKPLLEPKRK